MKLLHVLLLCGLSAVKARINEPPTALASNDADLQPEMDIQTTATPIVLTEQMQKILDAFRAYRLNPIENWPRRDSQALKLFAKHITVNNFTNIKEEVAQLSIHSPLAHSMISPVATYFDDCLEKLSKWPKQIIAVRMYLLKASEEEIEQFSAEMDAATTKKERNDATIEILLTFRDLHQLYRAIFAEVKEEKDKKEVHLITNKLPIG